jgi:hypothetical protein
LETSNGGEQVAEEVVRAKRFEVVDDEGEVRITLDAGPGDEAAVMAVQDRQGNNRAGFGILEDGSVALVLKDAEGNRRASLGIGEEAGDKPPRLTIADSLGRARVEIAVMDNGNVQIALADKWGQKRALLGVTEDVALGLYDADGNLVNGMVGHPPQ